MDAPNIIWRVLWGAGVPGLAIALVLVRPALAVRVAGILLWLLMGVWLTLCATGIAAQWQQGRGLASIERVTPFHAPHALLNHAVVILAFLSILWAVPLAIERAVRTRQVMIGTLHLFLAGAALVLVLLSAFTGYLSVPPVDEGRYLRFRVLHTLLVPLLATFPIVGWMLVVRSYRRHLAEPAG